MIVSIESENFIGIPKACQIVVPIGTGDKPHTTLDLATIPPRAIVEKNLADGGAPKPWLDQIVVHRELIGRAGNLQDQIIALSLQRHFCRRHPGQQLDLIDEAARRMGLKTGLNHILPIPAAEHIDIVPDPDQSIVAFPPIQTARPRHPVIELIADKLRTNT